MKVNFRKSTVLVLSSLFVLFLFACKNPFLANADGKYQVSFVTNCDTKIDSYRTNKIESIRELTKDGFEFDGWYTNSFFNGDPITLPYEVKGELTLYAKWKEIFTVTFETNCDLEIASYKTKKIESLRELTKDGFEFDGWYTNSSFEGEPISFPYEVTQNITLYAKWIDKDNIVYIYPDNYKENNVDYIYSDGVLSISTEKERIVFNGTFNDLSIKLNKANAKIIFDNFILSSSKASHLIESSFDFAIKYTGVNKLSSSSSSLDFLIKSSGTIEIKGDDKSSLELQPNSITTTDCAIVRASKVIINGGNFVIKGSNGSDGTSDGCNGWDGSTGIKADVEIKNNSVVTINGGNGGNGIQGITGKSGGAGYQSDLICTNGGPGEPGGAGGTGGTGGLGGYAIYGKVKVESSKLLLFGGKGGDGGAGGTGGTGGTGGRCTAWWSTGGAGGRGGNGGSGGSGGNGGYAVYGTIEVETAELVLSGGDGGKGGKGGNGGNGGKGGNCNNGPDTHVGSGGKGGNGGKGGSRGNGGDVGTIDKQQDTTMSLSGGKSGTEGNSGNSGNDGFIGNRV